MSADPTRRFSSVAADYARYRPSYPDALVDWIIHEADLAPGARVADIGCGTGISTRLFAVKGLDALGVEPNDAMRGQAEREGGARYLKGRAEATGFPAASFDLASAAQCFHWFEEDAALAEFSRIVRPGGRCCAFWNLRASTPVLRDYAEALLRFSEDYRREPKGRETLERLKTRAGLAGRRDACFPNSQTFDLAGLLGRAHSMSYVAVGVADPAGLDRALEEVFRRHEKGGLVAFDYEACAVMWTP